MRRRPRPRGLDFSAPGWIVLFIVGAVLLPLSPVVALIAMVVCAYLYDVISKAIAEQRAKKFNEAYRKIREEIESKQK